MSRATQMQELFFETLTESQYWPAERLRDFQRVQLGRLLRHARANVPFYEERLNPVLKPDGDIDWDKWTAIPTVARQDLIDHRDAMQARNLPADQGAVATFSTSGSTGAPVVTTHNALATLMSQAAMYRSYGWHQLDWSRPLGSWYGDDPMVGVWPDRAVTKPWGLPWDPRASGLQHELNRLTSAAQVLDYMARHEIGYFTGGATDMRLLAYEAARLGVTVGLDAIITRSAMHTDYGRRLLERSFGANVIPLYSSKEGYKMALRCPTGQHYHVNAEIVLVEVLAADGRSCAAGELGRVVVTPLFSTAQPLIRYEQGDMAIAGTICACGRTLPVIQDIVGRQKHIFRMPDGRSVLPRVPAPPLEALDAQNFQIAQVAPLHIEVRYVPRDMAIVGDEASLAAEILRQTDSAMRVSFKRLAAFRTDGRRKHLEYVSELQNGL